MQDVQIKWKVKNWNPQYTSPAVKIIFTAFKNSKQNLKKTLIPVTSHAHALLYTVL